MNSLSDVMSVFQKSTTVMRYSFLLLGLLFVGVFGVFKFLSASILPNLLTNLGLGLLALVIADLGVKLVVNVVPRVNLPHLEKRAVFITGCSSGFGLQLAKRLDALGVTVYAGLRNSQCAGALELQATCSKNLHIVIIDVTKDEDVKNAVKYVNKTIGDKVFWSLVNNAGISIFGLTEWVDVTEYRRLYETNVLGCVRVTQAFLPLLRENQGRIVVTGSVSGRFAYPFLIPYSMTKFALTSYVDGLRREMRQWGVGVYWVQPHLYRTNLSELEVVVRQSNQVWGAATEEVKSSYGEDFFKNYLERGTGYIGENASNNIDEPVSDLIDAAVGATPQYCYTPGMKARFEMFLARYLPIYLIELMFLLFQYCYTPGMKARFEMFLARYLPIYLTDIYTEMNVNLKFPAAVLERKRLQRDSKKLH
uniref:Uncharacterized protein n=1 Tax=Timema tahoe TaxID=61484 RepID=A0A7R9IK50_9NEOP|nr:unnamed protein product [Timema tahoe]